MNYQEVIDFLFSQLPIFQRIGSAAYKADLSNTIQLCKILGNPEKKFKSIHIAGTNGKGSCSHIIASIFQETGFKTGLYTSPHLKDFRERIRINGQMIPETEVINFVTNYKNDFLPIQPSFFEITVGMAFEYFAKEKVDIAILETGLGGRLDSTNVVTPELSIITNIGIDHTNFLGDTLEKIASEKAGIIKKTIPVVIGETQQETKEVFIEKAKKEDAPIFFADSIIDIDNLVMSPETNTMRFDVKQNKGLIFSKLHADLYGKYQLKNIATCLQSIMLLKKVYRIPDKAIIEGLINVKNNTGLKGRWQVISKNPLTITDTGHNKDGIEQVLKQIESTPHNNLHFVLGMVNDKTIDGVLALLPKSATYYFCKADIPRGMPVKELETKANQFGLKGLTFPSVRKALEAARKNAEENDLVFVGGSTFTVAEIL